MADNIIEFKKKFLIRTYPKDPELVESEDILPNYNSLNLENKTPALLHETNPHNEMIHSNQNNQIKRSCYT